MQHNINSIFESHKCHQTCEFGRKLTEFEKNENDWMNKHCLWLTVADETGFGLDQCFMRTIRWERMKVALTTQRFSYL